MASTGTLALPAPRARRLRVLAPIIEASRAAAETALTPYVVAPLLFLSLGGSLVATGVVLFLCAAAGALGSAFATLLRRAPHAIAVQAALGGVQALALLLLAGATALPPTAGGSRLALFAPVLMAATLLGNSVAALRAHVARGGAASKVRGMQNPLLAGSAGAIVMALLVRAGSSVTDVTTPRAYALPLILAGAATMAGVLLSLVLPGPGPSQTDDKVSPVGTLFGLLADNLAYGRLLLFQIVYQLGSLADPFFIVYATRELNGDARAATGFLLTLVVSRTASILVLRGVTGQLSNRAILQLAAFVRLVASITALTLLPLLGSAVLRERFALGSGALLTGFAVVFVALGAAGAAVDLATPALIVSITTPREQAAAQLLSRITHGGTSAVFILGGLIADRLGYPFLFIVALIVGLMALLSSGLVDAPGLIVLRQSPDARHEFRRHHE